MDLSCRHVAASLAAAPTIFTARRTVVLPAKRPELRCDSTRTHSRFVPSFLAAAKIAIAALVRIWRFIDPREFGADLFGLRKPRPLYEYAVLRPLTFVVL